MCTTLKYNCPLVLSQKNIFSPKLKFILQSILIYFIFNLIIICKKIGQKMMKMSIINVIFNGDVMSYSIIRRQHAFPFKKLLKNINRKIIII